MDSPEATEGLAEGIGPLVILALGRSRLGDGKFLVPGLARRAAMDELWVQLRDLASINEVENDLGIL